MKDEVTIKSKREEACVENTVQKAAVFINWGRSDEQNDSCRPTLLKMQQRKENTKINKNAVDEWPFERTRSKGVFAMGHLLQITSIIDHIIRV